MDRPVTPRLAMLPALAGLALLYLLGAAAWTALIAVPTYLVALRLPSTDRAITLVAAPLPALMTVDIPSLLSLQAAAVYAAGFALIAPAFHALGGRIPRPDAALALAPVAVVLFLIGPWAPSFFASDIAPRTQILILAAALLIAYVIPTTKNPRPTITFRQEERRDAI